MDGAGGVVRLAKLFALPAVAALACFAQDAESDLPETPGTYAVMETSLGRIVALLYDDIAPITVKNFIELATGAKETKDKKGKMVRRPYYDGLTFHRIIKGFMIQTGDVKGTGSGECGIPNIPDEFSDKINFDNPGSLGMANTGKPNSGSCQFFITTGRSHHLDGRHTIFGQVLQGHSVAVAISTVPTGSDDRPKTPVILKSVTIRTRR